MWHLRDGIGFLNELERRPFLDAAGMIADELTDEMSGAKQTFYGIPHFDRRERRQRLRLLTEVVTALAGCDVPAPVPTACLDGTVVATLNRVLEMLSEEVEAEIRDQTDPEVDLYSWRRSVRAALKAEPAAELTFRSVDLAVWARAIDELRERVLGRRQPISDVTPESLEYESILGCSDCWSEEDRYYATFPTTPDLDDLPRLWRHLRALTHIDCNLPSSSPQLVPRPCFLVGDSAVSRRSRNN